MPDVPSKPNDDAQAAQRDYALADDLALDSPERLKAIADPLRSLIVDLVLERAMSVTELASLTGRAKGTVAHHVDVLLAAGLVQVVHTRKVRAMEERFYGRTARTFVFPDTASHSSGPLPFLDDVLSEIDHAAYFEPADVAGTFTYRRARIPAAHVREFERRVHALALEFTDLPRGGDREYGLYLGLFPTNRIPAARRRTKER